MKKENKGMSIWLPYGISIGLLSSSLAGYVYINYLGVKPNKVFFSEMFLGFGFAILSCYYLNLIWKKKKGVRK